MIPCIRNKCLLYPACRNREEVECEEIRVYFWQLKHETLHIEHNEIWEMINKYLPKLQMIGEPTEYEPTVQNKQVHFISIMR